MKREEAKKKLWATGKINTLSKVECNALLDEVFDDHNAEMEKLKKWVNELLEKDRQRIAWKELVRDYYEDDDMFMEHQIDIENNFSLEEIIARDKK